MKKIIVILICCLALTKTNAQVRTQARAAAINIPQNDNPSIQSIEENPDWPTMLANLNTSQISSGVLYDKVTMFSNLITFNTVENNISGKEHFDQALSELYRASEQSRFISLNELKARTIGSSTNNIIDIGIINTTFQKLNFNEETPSSGGLLFQNGMFSSISNRPAFINKKVIIASPLKDIVSGSSFSFNFNNNLIFNNATTNIKTLVVDFNDNSSPVTVINNSSLMLPSINVNYTSSGIKMIKFTITFSDNSSIITYGKIYVDYQSSLQDRYANNTNSICYELLKDKGIFTSTIPFKGYTESLEVYGKIEYTIFYSYSNTAKKMLKPLIIVDGFDPKDKRKVQDCDCELDPVCKIANSDISFNFFVFPFLTITFNREKHDSIEDSMFYDGMALPSGTIPRVNLMNELRTKGYDVIIVNNPTYDSYNTAGQAVTIDGGADYIERNAMSLVSYIQSLKDRQIRDGSSEKLVLIGPSMGGQITRYALAHMEKKFAETNDPVWQHNARLWVSVDSPHLGANIPVGAQASIWFLADRLEKEPAKIQFYEELNSVAGKQQIISQFKNARETGFLNGNSFFRTYYNNLNTNGVVGSGGYPVSNSTFRKIAIVNGSLTGKKDASEQETFLYSRGYIRGVWPFQSSTITVLRLKDNFTPGSGQTGTVFKGDGQNSTVNIGFNHWNIDFSHPRYTLNVTNNSIKGSLDVVPGGYFNTAKYIREAVEKGLSDAGVRSETTNYIENHSFISTFSALGHLQPNQNWGNPLSDNLTCTTNKLTPFDSYYGTANNTEHISFTKESAAWLIKELQGIPQPPSFPLQANLITGANTICENTNSTFSINDICKVPSPAIWSVSPNLQIVSSTDYSVTVSQITNGSGTITATFQNGQTVTKTIWVGTPLFQIIKVSNVPGNINLELKTLDGSDINLQSLTNVVWDRSPTNTTFCGTVNGNGIYGSVDYNGNTCSTSVRVTSSNNCGTFTTTKTIIGRGTGMQKTSTNTNVYSIYPNPSNSIINIDLKDQNQKPISNTQIKAKLYNMMGEQKSTVEITNNIASINVSNLPKGIYVLKINIDGNIESHQVVVD